MTIESGFFRTVALVAGILVAGTGYAMSFGDMMNPSKWMGGSKDRDRYDDYYYRGPYGPGYPPYGYPPYGVGSGYGGGAPTTYLILPEGGEVTTATPATGTTSSGTGYRTAPAYGGAPGYGVAPGYGGPGYGVAPGYRGVPGYGAAPGRGVPPGYGAPPGRGAPPGYGAAPGATPGGGGTAAEIKRLKARVEELEMKR
jgi:hypothetical protein